MSLFKKEEPQKREGYDIYADKDILDCLEREMEPYGTIYQLCQSKGWIKIIERPGEETFDFVVDPDHASEFTDYLQRDVALKRRNKYKLL